MRDLIPDFNTYLFYKKEKKNIKTRSLFSGVGFGYRENIRMDIELLHLIEGGDSRFVGLATYYLHGPHIGPFQP